MPTPTLSTLGSIPGSPPDPPYNIIQIVSPTVGDAGEALTDNFTAIYYAFLAVLPLDGGTMTGDISLGGNKLDVAGGKIWDGGNMLYSGPYQAWMYPGEGSDGQWLADSNDTLYYGTADNTALADNNGKLYASNGNVITDADGNMFLPVNASAPSSPVAGQIYYNSTSNHFFGWNGTAWKQLDN